MFFPPESLKPEIQSQQIAVWLFSDGSQCAVLAKLSTVAIKALSQGAKVEFRIGFTEGHYGLMAIALTVHDSEDSPCVALSPIRNIKSINAVVQLTRSTGNFITLINEFDHVICHGTFTMEEGFPKKLLDGYLSIEQLYELRDYQTMNDLLDSFSHHIYPQCYPPSCFDMNSVSTVLTIENITNVLMMDFEPHKVARYKLGEGNEGTTQEELLALKLSILFKDKVYHSPQKIRGNKEREFVDILVLAGTYNLLISSKAMSLYETDYSKTLDRRISNLSSHAHEALGQLFGTAKSMKRNEVVRTATDKAEIDFDRTLSAHGVAIISEYLDSPTAWQECLKSVHQIYNDTGCMTQIVDVNEFLYMMKLANNSHERFAHILRTRFDAIIKNNSFSIYSIDSSLPLDIDDNDDL